MRDLRGARKRIPTEARFLRPKGYAFDTTASMTRHMRPHGSKRCRTTLTLTSAGLLSFGCGSRTGLPGLADGSTEDCSSATTVVLAAGQEHPLGVAAGILVIVTVAAGALNTRDRPWHSTTA